MKSILVTGGAGFIGSNFIRYMLGKPDFFRIVNLDVLTYAGNLENLANIEQDSRYTFIKGDVRNKDLVKQIFEKYGITHVVHFAAESHVDRSIEDAGEFLSVNILGTQVLLDTARDFWKVDPTDRFCRGFRQGVKFLQVSTDEVYGSLGPEGLFTEETPLAANNPYSASKAGADLLVRSYGETYGLPINITRCSNNYGPYQFPEKLIPLMIRNCKLEKKLPVYGDGLQIRDWLYVEDHCRAVETVMEQGKLGEVYNIGGNNERTNIQIVKLILKDLGKGEEWIEYVKDRPGHDRRYAIDSSKIMQDLGWKPLIGFEEGMKRTIAWYLENEEWMDQVASGSYMKYYEKMYSDRK